MTSELRPRTCSVVFPIHHFVHVSIPSRKLWSPDTFIWQIKGGIPGNRCELRVGVLEIGCGWVQIFALFNLAFIYANILPHLTFQKHASYNWQAATLNVHCNLFLLHHFAHISSISWNPGHLKLTRLIVGKWKVVRPGSKRNVCGKLTKSGCEWSECGRLLTAWF